jgi:hypothetical protein
MYTLISCRHVGVMLSWPMAWNIPMECQQSRLVLLLALEKK